MAGACEGQASAHSCCKSVVRPEQAALTAKAADAAKPAAGPLYLATMRLPFLSESVATSPQWFSHIHSPPGAAESLNTILRI